MTRQFAKDLDAWLSAEKRPDGYCDPPKTETPSEDIIKTLKAKGFIHPSNDGDYVISPAGKDFIEQGGFSKLYSEPIAAEKKEERRKDVNLLAVVLTALVAVATFVLTLLRCS